MGRVSGEARSVTASKRSSSKRTAPNALASSEAAAPAATRERYSSAGRETSPRTQPAPIDGWSRRARSMTESKNEPPPLGAGSGPPNGTTPASPCEPARPPGPQSSIGMNSCVRHFDGSGTIPGSVQ